MYKINLLKDKYCLYRKIEQQRIKMNQVNNNYLDKTLQKTTLDTRRRHHKVTKDNLLFFKHR